MKHLVYKTDECSSLILGHMKTEKDGIGNNMIAENVVLISFANFYKLVNALPIATTQIMLNQEALTVKDSLTEFLNKNKIAERSREEFERILQDALNHSKLVSDINTFRNNYHDANFPNLDETGENAANDIQNMV